MFVTLLCQPLIIRHLLSWNLVTVQAICHDPFMTFIAIPVERQKINIPIKLFFWVRLFRTSLPMSLSLNGCLHLHSVHTVVYFYSNRASCPSSEPSAEGPLSIPPVVLLCVVCQCISVCSVCNHRAETAVLPWARGSVDLDVQVESAVSPHLTVAQIAACLSVTSCICCISVATISRCPL